MGGSSSCITNRLALFSSGFWGKGSTNRGLDQFKSLQKLIHFTAETGPGKGKRGNKGENVDKFITGPYVPGKKIAKNPFAYSTYEVVIRSQVSRLPAIRRLGVPDKGGNCI